MPNEFSNINVNKVRHLRSFKIDYSRIRNIRYTDKDNLLPQSFSEYVKFFRPVPMVTEEQARPVFPPDLRYLQTYSAQQFPKGKILVLVNYELHEAVKSSIDQYVRDVAYEGYYAEAWRVKGGTPAQLHQRPDACFRCADGGQLASGMVRVCES